VLAGEAGRAQLADRRFRGEAAACRARTACASTTASAATASASDGCARGSGRSSCAASFPSGPVEVRAVHARLAGLAVGERPRLVLRAGSPTEVPPARPRRGVDEVAGD
jgi:hypothetical protein